MQNWWKKVICAGLVGVSVLTTNYTEAGVPNKFPLQCYASKQVTTYNSINGSRWGYISANADLIQITQINGDWAYGSYPASKGRISRWFRLSDIVPNLSFSHYETGMYRASKAYRTESSGTVLGTVYVNDKVTVVYRGSSRSQVIYPVSGGYKMGWVNNGDIKTVTQPAQNNSQIIKGDINGDGKVDDKDLDLLTRACLGEITLEGTRKNAADMNSDGRLTVSDLSELKQKVKTSATNSVSANNNGRVVPTNSSNTTVKPEPVSRNPVVPSGYSVAYPANGVYSFQPLHTSGKELTVMGAGTGNSTRVVIDNIGHKNNQRWEIRRVNGDWYTIKDVNSGKYLDNCGGAGKNGNVVSIWPDTATAEQWRFIKGNNGAYFIQANTANMFFLDVWGAETYANALVGLYQFNGSNAQQWRLEKSFTGTNAKSSSGYYYPLGRNVTFTDGTKFGKPHDYGAAQGTPVYAPFAGHIRCVQKMANISGEGYITVSYGNVIYLTNGNKEIRFAHLDRFEGIPAKYPGRKYRKNNVKATEVYCGERDVQAGELIGYVGTVGNSTGPHLHVEFRINGVLQNPNNYF